MKRQKRRGKGRKEKTERMGGGQRKGEEGQDEGEGRKRRGGS